MERLSDLLRALEDRGASLDYHEHAMVWLTGPDTGCFVRAASVFKIETYWHVKGETWSKVYLYNPSGYLETVVDIRRPKVVEQAVRTVELREAMALLDQILARVR
jgi:hypothetical protein